MTDPSSSDHWKSLASDLGAEMPESIPASGGFADHDESDSATTTAEVATTDTETTTTTEAPLVTDAPVGDETEQADGVKDEMQIVSLSPTGTEMLFAIGAGDLVIAVDEFSYYPPEAPVTELSGWDPNIEAIAGFEPTLVISEAPLDGLDSLGIENMVLSAAVSLDDIYAQIELLGATTDNVGEAAELVGQMQTDITAILATLPERTEPLTYYHELDQTLYSVTSTTFIGYVYDLLGLENVADPADADGSAFGYPQLNEEFILQADPDIIFLADTLCCDQNAETVATRPTWEQLSAVQNGNIVELNDDIVSRWGPRIVDFIEVAGTAVAAVEPAPVA
jgi:iron complex transport system substrate-binding protein